jgi:hypothetical protein
MFINVSGPTRYDGALKNQAPRSWLLKFTKRGDEVNARRYTTEMKTRRKVMSRVDGAIKLSNPFKMPSGKL